MARPRRVAAVVLMAGGVLLCLGGASGVAVGLLNPHLISDQLPRDAAIDAPAVGGAAVALGIGIAVVGLAHLVIAAALRRGFAPAGTAGVALAAPMGVLAFGFAVAALVSIASGAAPAIFMVPAAIVLGAAVVGYAAATMAMIRTREGHS